MAVKQNRLYECCGQTIGQYVAIKTKADLRYVQQYSKRVKPVAWVWLVWEPLAREAVKQHPFLDFDQAKAFYRQVKANAKNAKASNPGVKLCRPELIAVPIAIAEMPG